MNALNSIHNELNRLGYVDNLLQENYIFDDAAFPETREMTIPLAAFAQWPPSYRNACIGVLIANGQSGPRHISMYQTLGSPMFFEAFPDHIDRYRIEATGKAVFLESIPARDIRQAFNLNKKKGVLRQPFGQKLLHKWLSLYSSILLMSASCRP